MKQTERSERSPKKFNIVDFIIIVLAVALIAGACWKLSSASDSANQEASAQDAITHFDESPHMRFTVVCTGVVTEAATRIIDLEDTQLFNGDQELAAYITDCELRPTNFEITAADGTKITLDNPETRVLTFTIEGYFDRDEATENKTYQLGTQQVRIGKSYIVKTKSFEVNGYITAMEVVNE